VTSVLAIPTGSERYQFEGEIFSNPWSPDGTRILGISDRPVNIVGDTERRATIWDGNSGAVLFDIIDPILVPTQGVSWNADGSMILTGSSTEKGGLLYGWDGQTGDFLFEITGQPDGTHRIIPHPTRNIIAISYIADYGEKQSLLRIYDLESRQSIELVEFPIRYIDHFTWHPDGQSLAVEGSDGNIWLWDTSTFR
jgi:WD40 repeat protein